MALKIGDKVIIESYKGKPTWTVLNSFMDALTKYYVVECMCGNTSNIAFIDENLKSYSLDYFTNTTQEYLSKILLDF